MARVDFRRLGTTQRLRASDQHTNPRKLFDSLTERDESLPYLRGPQDQVLNAWHQRRAERDLVVKINTGGGKTVVGLMIAKSWLNEGVSPVAYFVPDKMLVSQVVDQAKLLGLDVSTQPDAPFTQGKSILVTTFETLFNSKSRFGLNGTYAKRVQYTLGGFVVDDAHACIAKAQEKFRLAVPRTLDGKDNSAYFELFKLFKDDLRIQSGPATLEIETNGRSGVLEVPFWCWQAKQEQITSILSGFARSQEWSAWSLIADSLANCMAVFSSDELQVQPFCLPTNQLIGFERAQRRVYLTATLADDSPLVRDLGASPQSVAHPVVPEGAGDIGDRMILLPQQLLPNATDDQVRAWVAEWAEDERVVVIAPGEEKARAWEPFNPDVLAKENIQQSLTALKESPTPGLTVMVNRYDGVDLPGDACHFLVLDGLPEARGAIERVMEARDTEANGLEHQQIHRIEQGMGRATRSNIDYAVVVLIGKSLSDRLVTAMEHFSPATQTQFAQASHIAEEIKATRLDDLDDLVNQCLDRDQDWIDYAKEDLAALNYEDTRPNISAEHEREAFLAAIRNDFSSAAALQEQALSEAALEPVRAAVLRQRLAAYTNHFDSAKAQEIQKSAQRDNPQVTRPMEGAKYEALQRATRSQAESASRYLQDQYASGNQMLVRVKAILDDLTWGPRTKAFEKALAVLGEHLGYKTQRPELQFLEGPDGLWAATDAAFVVIEAKSGSHDTHPIYKGDAEQISMAINWFENKYPNSRAIPLLIAPTAVFEHDASWPSNCRVMDEDGLADFRKAIDSFFCALAMNDGYRDVKRVASELATNGLSEKELTTRFAKAPMKRRAPTPK